MNEHVVGVIPARFASTRLPGKPLLVLAEKPLIQWVWEAASKSSLVQELIVATDDERIANECGRFGATVVMTSVHCPSGSDRIAEALRGRGGDVVVNLQGDEPLLDPNVLDSCVEALLNDSNADVCSAMTRINTEEVFHNPNAVKVVTDSYGYAMYFSRAPIPSMSRVGEGNLWPVQPMKHLGLYVYRRSALEAFVNLKPSRFEECEKLEQLRFLEAGYKIRMVEVADEGVGVDTPEDARRVEELLISRG